jgi:hypothetical protein
MRVERFNDVSLLGIPGTEIDIPAGRAAGISLSFYGTNGAGATLTMANITAGGLIRLTYKGRPLFNVNATSLFQYDDLKGGLPPFASAAAGAFRTTFHIPFRFGGFSQDNPDDNVINIEPNSMRLFLPSPVVAVTLPTAVNCEVGLIEDMSGNSRYFPYMFDSQYPMTAALNVPVNGPNVRSLLLQRPSGGALPNSVQFTMGTTKLLEGPWMMIEDNSNIYNRIEAAAINAILAEIGNANPASYQGGQYRLFLLGGAAGNTIWITEMGSFPASVQDYTKTKNAALTSMALARSTSTAPASSAVSGITNGKQVTTAVAVSNNMSRGTRGTGAGLDTTGFSGLVS